MIRHRDHFHGSDLEKIEAIYQIRKEDIISFSANVNPLGISPRLRKELASHVDVISTYPDREYARLRGAISAYCGAESSDIVVGNGTSELISLFVQITKPRRALILGPTYSEYEREISGCPNGDHLGLNILSEAYVHNSASLSQYDFFISKETVGNKITEENQGSLIRPSHLLFCSPKLYRVIKENNLKGFNFEVAHVVG